MARPVEILMEPELVLDCPVVTFTLPDCVPVLVVTSVEAPSPLLSSLFEENPEDTETLPPIFEGKEAVPANMNRDPPESEVTETEPPDLESDASMERFEGDSEDDPVRTVTVPEVDTNDAPDTTDTDPDADVDEEAEDITIRPVLREFEDPDFIMTSCPPSTRTFEDVESIDLPPRTCLQVLGVHFEPR